MKKHFDLDFEGIEVDYHSSDVLFNWIRKVSISLDDFIIILKSIGYYPTHFNTTTRYSDTLKMYCANGETYLLDFKIPVFSRDYPEFYISDKNTSKHYRWLFMDTYRGFLIKETALNGYTKYILEKENNSDTCFITSEIKIEEKPIRWWNRKKKS